MTPCPARAHSRTVKNELTMVRFESPDVGGVKLVKTWTLKRGAYDIAVQARSGQHRQRRRFAPAVSAAGA
jgi:hypothetical protein